MGSTQRSIIAVADAFGVDRINGHGDQGWIFHQECQATRPGSSLRGTDRVNILRRFAAERGTPKRNHCDNGSEFAGRLVDLWADANGVVTEYFRPGKPTDNGIIESFNGTLREECPSVLERRLVALERFDRILARFLGHSFAHVLKGLVMVTPSIRGPCCRSSL